MRGMKKWMPFKSLKGQYETLDKMKNERKKQTMPELSIDEIDDLNHALTSLKKGDRTSVTYFTDGEIKKKDVVFLRCDGYSRTVSFKEVTIPFASLIRFE